MSRTPATEQPAGGPPTAPSTAEGLADWLRIKIADLIGVEPSDIDPHAPLLDYGLESRQALILLGDVEDLLDRKLPATMAWDYPTIADLAAFIAARLKESSTGE